MYGIGTTYTVSKMDEVLNIMSVNGYNDTDVLNVYVAGSRLYGNITDVSDHDYVIIVCAYSNNNDNHNIRHNNVDLTVISVEDMNRVLSEHNVQRLINIFTPSEFILRSEITFTFVLDCGRLRSAVSEISNKCMHHAKRSWHEGDHYKSKKHLVHSIRYVEFAIQIVQHGTIIDMTVSNPHSTEIMAEDNTLGWKYFHDKYGTIAKNLYKNEFLSILPS